MVDRSTTETVTLLFTDIEGSTRLWERYPLAMGTALELHNGIVRLAITTHDGVLFYSGGDSIGAAFANPADAVAAAIGIQEDLAAVDWGEVESILVRIGLDTGIAEFHDGDYVGPPVNRAARVLDQADGGEILLTSTTADLVRHRLPEGAALYERGAKPLAGVDDPVRIYEVGKVDAPPGRRRVRVMLAAAAALTALLIVAAITVSVILDGTDAMWRVAVAGRPSAPLISDGVVYVGTDESGSGGAGRLYAIDLRTGEVLWEYSTASAIRHTPVEVDGFVYLTRAQEPGDLTRTSSGSNFLVVEGATGALSVDCFIPSLSLGSATELGGRIYVAAASSVFDFPTEQAAQVDGCDYQPSSPFAVIEVGPAAVDGLVLVGAGPFVYALSTDSMSELWRSLFAQGELVTYCANLDWVDAILIQIRTETSINSELLVFARDWEGRLYRSRGDTGEVTHDVDVGPSYSDQCSPVLPAGSPPLVRGRPLLTEDGIYAPTFDDELAALSHSLEFLWTVPVGPVLVGPILDQATVYLVTEDGVLRAIDTQRRAETWALEIADGSTGLAAAEGIVVITGDSGVVAYEAP